MPARQDPRAASPAIRPRRQRRRLWFAALAEDRRVVALAYFQNESLVRAFFGEVLLQPLAEHRGVNPNDVVGGVVVVGPPSEYLVATSCS
jgi:hypothetical protein